MTTSDYDVDREQRLNRDSRRLQDAVINSQLDSHYAQKFRQHFPNNIEHCLRMAQEQLQSGLKSRNLSTSDIVNLSTAVYNIHRVYRNL